MPETIALGLGNNVDYEIVWDAQVVESLITHYGVRAEELDTGLDTDRPIRTERNLLISILAFLRAGTGGERFVADSAILEQFAARFARQITLGGTSVRAASAMRKLGYTSALHLVTTNEHVRRLIPPDSPTVCSSERDSLHPHLIVQFPPGACVRTGDMAGHAGGIHICAPRANRLIYHNDHDNIAMRLNEDFARLISGARVFLISGFNAMQSQELLAQRLQSLLRIMDSLPPNAEVFFEDACFYNPSFHRLIHAVLDGRISIFSLNEDELQEHVGRRLDLLDAAAVAAALSDLRRLISVPTVVVHSMYWALAYGADAARYARALKGGVTMATTRFCYGDDFSVEEYRRVANLPPNPQGATFAAAISDLLRERVCCVPVAQVEQSNPTTIGLGDAFVGGFLPALA